MHASNTVDQVNSATGWTVLGDSTDTLTTSTATVDGAGALSFAKIAGTTTIAAAYRTLACTLRISGTTGRWRLHDRICWLAYLSDLTNVAYTFVRLGTDASNYCEWRFADTSLTAGRWTLCSAKLGDAYVVGTGWAENSVTYIAVGVGFDANANTLAGILMGKVSLEPAQFTTS